MSSTQNKGLEAIADTQMTDISKEFFFEGMLLPVNVYLRINPGSYLIIGKKGDKASFAQLHSYNNPNVNAYVYHSDKPTLIQYVQDLTTKVLHQKNVPEAVKVKFISGLAEEGLDSLAKSGFTSVSQLQKVSELIVQMAQTQAPFDEIFKVMVDLPASEAKHGMTSCMICMLLCEEMQVKLPAAQEKIAMACLLHDVGLKHLPKSIFEKPRHLWSADEMMAFEQHPIVGVEMLRDIKDIPSDVLLMISEHHENSLGTGFPKRIRDVKISPLGKILILGNYFSNLLFSATGKPYTPDEAIQYIEDIMGQPFNKQAFIGLKNIVNKKYLADKKA